jgi:spore coat polysaccharide biosynthesis protein SpsF
MLKTLGIVQPRLDGAGAWSHLARRLGGKPLLEWVVRRVTECQRLDRVIVLLGPGSEQARLAELAPPDIPVFLGRGDDLLGCYVAALDAYPAQSLVRVFADNPYTDPVLIDRLVKTADEHPDCDYISYRSRDGRPAILSSVGVFGEWCRADALRQADREARAPADRQHVTRYLFSHPESFRMRLVPTPRDLDRHAVRLSVDCHEDWEHAQTLHDALGPDALDWRAVTSRAN